MESETKIKPANNDSNLEPSTDSGHGFGNTDNVNIKHAETEAAANNTTASSIGSYPELDTGDQLSQPEPEAENIKPTTSPDSSLNPTDLVETVESNIVEMNSSSPDRGPDLESRKTTDQPTPRDYLEHPSDSDSFLLPAHENGDQTTIGSGTNIDLVTNGCDLEPSTVSLSESDNIDVVKLKNSEKAAAEPIVPPMDVASETSSTTAAPFGSNAQLDAGVELNPSEPEAEKTELTTTPDASLNTHGLVKSVESTVEAELNDPDGDPDSKSGKTTDQPTTQDDLEQSRTESFTGDAGVEEIKHDDRDGESVLEPSPDPQLNGGDLPPYTVDENKARDVSSNQDADSDKIAMALAMAAMAIAVASQVNVIRAKNMPTVAEASQEQNLASQADALDPEISALDVLDLFRPEPATGVKFAGLGQVQQAKIYMLFNKQQKQMFFDLMKNDVPHAQAVGEVLETSGRRKIKNQPLEDCLREMGLKLTSSGIVGTLAASNRGWKIEEVAKKPSEIGGRIVQRLKNKVQQDFNRLQKSGVPPVQTWLRLVQLWTKPALNMDKTRAAFIDEHQSVIYKRLKGRQKKMISELMAINVPRVQAIAKVLDMTVKLGIRNKNLEKFFSKKGVKMSATGSEESEESNGHAGFTPKSTGEMQSNAVGPKMPVPKSAGDLDRLSKGYRRKFDEVPDFYTKLQASMHEMLRNIGAPHDIAAELVVGISEKLGIENKRLEYWLIACNLRKPPPGVEDNPDVRETEHGNSTNKKRQDPLTEQKVSRLNKKWQSQIDKLLNNRQVKIKVEIRNKSPNMSRGERIEKTLQISRAQGVKNVRVEYWFKARNLKLPSPSPDDGQTGDKDIVDVSPKTQLDHENGNQRDNIRVRSGETSVGDHESPRGTSRSADVDKNNGEQQRPAGKIHPPRQSSFRNDPPAPSKSLSSTAPSSRRQDLPKSVAKGLESRSDSGSRKTRWSAPGTGGIVGEARQAKRPLTVDPAACTGNQASKKSCSGPTPPRKTLLPTPSSTGNVPLPAPPPSGMRFSTLPRNPQQADPKPWQKVSDSSEPKGGPSSAGWQKASATKVIPKTYCTLPKPVRMPPVNLPGQSHVNPLNHLDVPRQGKRCAEEPCSIRENHPLKKTRTAAASSEDVPWYLMGAPKPVPKVANTPYGLPYWDKSTPVNPPGPSHLTSPNVRDVAQQGKRAEEPHSFRENQPFEKAIASYSSVPGYIMEAPKPVPEVANTPYELPGLTRLPPVTALGSSQLHPPRVLEDPGHMMPQPVPKVAITPYGLPDLTRLPPVIAPGPSQLNPPNFPNLPGFMVPQPVPKVAITPYGQSDMARLPPVNALGPSHLNPLNLLNMPQHGKSAEVPRSFRENQPAEEAGTYSTSSGSVPGYMMPELVPKDASAKPLNRPDVATQGRRFAEERCSVREYEPPITQTAATSSDLHVYIVPNRNSAYVDETEMNEIENGILDAVWEIQDDRMRPHFEGSFLNNGRYEVICRDAFSKHWLERYVGTLPNAPLNIISAEMGRKCDDSPEIRDQDEKSSSSSQENRITTSRSGYGSQGEPRRDVTRSYRAEDQVTRRPSVERDHVRHQPRTEVTASYRPVNRMTRSPSPDVLVRTRQPRRNSPRREVAMEPNPEYLGVRSTCGSEHRRDRVSGLNRSPSPGHSRSTNVGLPSLMDVRVPTPPNVRRRISPDHLASRYGSPPRHKSHSSGGLHGKYEEQTVRRRAGSPDGHYSPGGRHELDYRSDSPAKARHDARERSSRAAALRRDCSPIGGSHHSRRSSKSPPRRSQQSPYR